MGRGDYHRPSSCAEGTRAYPQMFPPGEGSHGSARQRDGCVRLRQQTGTANPTGCRVVQPRPASLRRTLPAPRVPGATLPHLTPCGTGRARDAGLVHLVAAKKAVCGAGCLQAFERRATGRYQTLGFGMRSRRVSACLVVSEHGPGIVTLSRASFRDQPMSRTDTKVARPTRNVAHFTNMCTHVMRLQWKSCMS